MWRKKVWSLPWWLYTVHTACIFAQFCTKKRKRRKQAWYPPLGDYLFSHCKKFHLKKTEASLILALVSIYSHSFKIYTVNDKSFGSDGKLIYSYILNWSLLDLHLGDYLFPHFKLTLAWFSPWWLFIPTFYTEACLIFTLVTIFSHILYVS